MSENVEPLSLYALYAQERPMPPLAVTVPMMRKRMRDLPKFNELVREHLTDEEYADCIIDALADFNGRSPFFSAYDNENFPDRKLLLDMTVCEAVDRLMMWHAANNWSAQDAGLTVPIHEQWQPLMNVIGVVKQKAEVRAERLKAQLNVSRAMGGGVSSPLWLERPYA